MANYRVGQVIDRLLVLTRALAGHRDPNGTMSTDGLVTVYDGPEVRSTDDAIDSTLLIIGWSGDDTDALEEAASSSWTSGPIAATSSGTPIRPRDETTTVSCKVISQRAETMKAARDGAITELEAVAQLCRNDPSLGIDTSATIGGVRTLAWVTAGSMVQYLDAGYVCELDFTVSYNARV
jgi:hypothetical protein